MKRLTFAVWLSAFLYAGPLAWAAELVMVEGGATGLTELLARSGAPAGVVVHVGCGNGEGSVSLTKQNDTYVVQGLDAHGESLDSARHRARMLGLAGRLSFKHWEGGRLPYADSLVNVLFWQKPDEDADMEEILRVLAPDGTAYIQQGAEWRNVTKPWPDEIDEWSHFRYDAGNTGASKDTRVGPPNHIQWEAGPRFMRSHEIETGLSSMVSTKGRVYYILDEGPLGITDARFPAKWSLICRDAFNGVFLWKRPMPNWGWRAWNAQRVNTPGSWLATRHHSSAEVDRLMVAHGDTLYVTLGFGGPISSLDGATGEVLMTYEGTAGTLECIFVDGLLVTRHDHPTAAITATRADDGKMLWRREAEMIVGRSLCAAAGRVFFHTRRALIAIDLTTGDERWRYETDLRPSALIAHRDAVLAVQSSVTLALSTRTGEELWRGPGAGIRGRNPDLFVVGDHVYWGRGRFEVRHIRTGEITKKLDLQQVLKSGHHRRCFTDKASANYMITGERGSEFLDLHDHNHKRHNWFRGPCLTGIMPANGLFYVPPHQCFCYPAVRMDGFFALASEVAAPPSGADDGPASRLEKGPAYGRLFPAARASADEWPTYRHDAKRSGATVSEAPTELSRRWSKTLGGSLAQAIVADGKVFLASKGAGTVHCLDLDDGALIWSRTVSGPIDSPPSYHEGFVIFGSRDGHVYSLRASDGALAWRFLAAPEERQVVSYDRLESAWPAHGSVLILDGLAYCSAGRSGFIDDGIYLYALDPITGEIVHQTRLEGPYPDIRQPSYAFHHDGYRSDLFTTDGQYLYMGRTALDRNLKVVETERIQLIGNQRGDELEYRKMPGMRLVATGGFLNETFWNRTWWMYSYVWPGYHFAVQAPKSGQLLAFDDQHTYTIKHYTTRNLHSPMQFPGNGYLLFADDNDNEPLFYRGQGEPEPVEWEIDYPPSQRPEVNLFGDAAHDKGPGFSRARPARWTSWIDVRVEAMVLAGDTLFVAGTPDAVPQDDPLAALEGRRGGVLLAVSTKDGKELARYTLNSPPVFDGLSTAKGRLLISTREGDVICMGQK
jgi:outer membrane protein assembly factor BamB/SAM-dependent methyltransferase